MNGRLRTIRSFVRREGRMTDAQHQALARLWGRYGVDADERQLDLNALFAREAPRVLEIGFGNGETLLHMAALAPDTDFLGVEVYRPGIGRLFQSLEQSSLNNVRVIYQDAVEVMYRRLPAASLDKLLLFFPDPWPKKRHHKRRIVQPAFMEQVRQLLKVGGIFHMATDWEGYAEYVLAVMRTVSGFHNLAGVGSYSPRSVCRPRTKFEVRGRRLGHAICDLVFERRG